MRNVWCAFFVFWGSACKTVESVPSEAIIVPPAPTPRPFCDATDFRLTVDEAEEVEQIVEVISKDMAKLKGDQKDLLDTLNSFVRRGDRVMIAHVVEIGMLDDIDNPRMRQFWRLVYEMAQLFIEHPNCAALKLALCQWYLAPQNDIKIPKRRAAMIYLLNMAASDSGLYFCVM